MIELLIRCYNILKNSLDLFEKKKETLSRLINHKITKLIYEGNDIKTLKIFNIPPYTSLVLFFFLHFKSCTNTYLRKSPSNWQHQRLVLLLLPDNAHTSYTTAPLNYALLPLIRGAAVDPPRGTSVQWAVLVAESDTFSARFHVPARPQRTIGGCSRAHMTRVCVLWVLQCGLASLGWCACGMMACCMCRVSCRRRCRCRLDERVCVCVWCEGAAVSVLLHVWTAWPDAPDARMLFPPAGTEWQTHFVQMRCVGEASGLCSWWWTLSGTSGGIVLVVDGV